MLMADVPPGSLVKALGTGWVACADALPWNDHYSWLRYAVYSPSYCGDVFICQFMLSGASWWHEGLQVGIGGVTHWRLAGEHEQDFMAAEGQLPGQGSEVSPLALAELRRWWKWFAESRGLDL